MRGVNTLTMGAKLLGDLRGNPPEIDFSSPYVRAYGTCYPCVNVNVGNAIDWRPDDACIVVALGSDLEGRECFSASSAEGAWVLPPRASARSQQVILYLV